MKEQLEKIKSKALARMEAAQALAVLGYTSQEVSAALKGVDVDGLPLEEIIRQALKRMATP